MRPARWPPSPPQAWVQGEAVPAVGTALLTYISWRSSCPWPSSSRRQPGARRALWIAALAAFAVSAMHLAQLHTGRDPWPVELLGHHASVPLALAILYQDYPFAFADLFLKRALMLTALVAAAFVGLATLGLPGQGGTDLVSVGPRDVAVIVSLWVATALCTPAAAGYRLVCGRHRAGPPRLRVAARDGGQTDSGARSDRPALGRGVRATWGRR